LALLPSGYPQAYERFLWRTLGRFFDFLLRPAVEVGLHLMPGFRHRRD
jgi:hypothetical protein